MPPRAAAGTRSRRQQRGDRLSNELKSLRSEADYANALAEAEQLWGAKWGTRQGDRLDILATLIDAYEAEHYPMDPPDAIEAIKFRIEQTTGLS